jgi:hypothetical protein
VSIRQKDESGHVPDVASAIREARRLLDDQERQLAALRAKLRVGLDELNRGEGAEWTPALMKQLRHGADEMFHRGEQPDPDVCP